MERVVIAGTAADRGQGSVRKVEVDIPALGFGVLANAFARSPCVHDKCVLAR